MYGGRDSTYYADGRNSKDNKTLVETYTPDSAPSTTNDFAQWLYGDWDEEKLAKYRFLNVIPGISQYMDYLLDMRRDREYMDRNGLDYKDIHDPRNLPSHDSTGRLYGSALNFISDNIKRLYR